MSGFLPFMHPDGLCGWIWLTSFHNCIHAITLLLDMYMLLLHLFTCIYTLCSEKGTVLVTKFAAFFYFVKLLNCWWCVHLLKGTCIFQRVFRQSGLSLDLCAFVTSAGIQGAFDGAGCKTVIPRKVVGKFSIRLVPNMEPGTVERLVIDYLNDVQKKRDSPNTVKFVHWICRNILNILWSRFYSYREATIFSFSDYIVAIMVMMVIIVIIYYSRWSNKSVTLTAITLFNVTQFS